MQGTLRKVKLNVWPVQSKGKYLPSTVFPEQKLGYVKVTDRSVGIAASGGGSRSHALCSGYFRALRDLGKLDEVTYLSSVSGGSWASAILTYAKIDDQRLLGKKMNPKDLTLDVLKTHKPGALAGAVSGFLRNPFVLFPGKVEEHTPSLWPRYISTSLLQQFNLDRKLFTLNEEHRAEILEQNKDNTFITDAYDSFVCPPKDKKRPFLIINGVLEGPRGYASGWGAPFQVTPLYSGVPFYAQSKYSFHYLIFGGSSMIFAVASAIWNVFFASKHSKLLQKLLNRDLGTNIADNFFEDKVGWNLWKRKIAAPLVLLKTSCRIAYQNWKGIDYSKPINLISGGGFISTHAFGVQDFEKEESFFGGNDVIGLTTKGDPFYLEEAVGISSAAYVAHGLNAGLYTTVPNLPYLPVLSGTDETFGLAKYKELNLPKHRVRAFGDGGNFENTGILPLVQRGVKRIIAFINTSQPLLSKSINFQRGNYRYNGDWCADEQFLCLFGQGYFLNFAGNYTLNQIFDETELDDVLIEMLRNRDQLGKGAVAKKTLRVIENKYWGIPGGDDVEILFVYNDRCDEFNNALPVDARSVVGQPKKNMFDRKANEFSDFPQYPTMRLGKGRIFSLTESQINLATAHADYLLSEANRDVTLEMFK